MLNVKGKPSDGIDIVMITDVVWNIHSMITSSVNITVIINHLKNTSQW